MEAKYVEVTVSQEASETAESTRATQNLQESKTSEQPAGRPLFRHPTHRLIGGVCGGIGDYLNFDPALVRVLWVVLTIGTAGAGFLAYLALWLLLPVGTAHAGMQEPAALELNEQNVQRAGLLLVGFGVLWLLANVGVLPWIWSAFWNVVGVLFWPALLIGAGLLLLKNQKEWRASFTEWRARFRRGVRHQAGTVKVDRASIKSGLREVKERIPIKRSRAHRILLGICGGLGESLGIDANLVRLFWVIFALSTAGVGVLVYILIGLILPERQDAEAIEYEQEPRTVQIIDGTVH